MKQNVSWPVVALAIGAMLLVLAAVFYRGAIRGGSQARVSPQFLQMSPQEQKEALLAAEMARRRRGAPQPAGGR